MSQSFKATKRFFDNKYYPKGFSRHGDFTIKESQLLEKYGYAFKDLNDGNISASTKDEISFVSVCKGEKKPNNEYEKVWIKYLNCINKSKKFHTLSGGKPQVDSNDDFSDSDD